MQHTLHLAHQAQHVWNTTGVLNVEQLVAHASLPVAEEAVDAQVLAQERDALKEELAQKQEKLKKVELLLDDLLLMMATLTAPDPWKPAK